MKKERDRRLSLAIESDINEIYGYPIFSGAEEAFDVAYGLLMGDKGN